MDEDINDLLSLTTSFLAEIEVNLNASPRVQEISHESPPKTCDRPRRLKATPPTIREKSLQEMLDLANRLKHEALLEVETERCKNKKLQKIISSLAKSLAKEKLDKVYNLSYCLTNLEADFLSIIRDSAAKVSLLGVTIRHELMAATRMLELSAISLKNEMKSIRMTFEHERALLHDELHRMEEKRREIANQINTMRESSAHPPTKLGSQEPAEDNVAKLQVQLARECRSAETAWNIIHKLFRQVKVPSQSKVDATIHVVLPEISKIDTMIDKPMSSLREAARSIEKVNERVHEEVKQISDRLLAQLELSLS